MVTAAEQNFPLFNLSEGNTGRGCTVPQLDCQESFRTLGIHKTISGDQKGTNSHFTSKKRQLWKRDIVQLCKRLRSLDGLLHHLVPELQLSIGCNFPIA
jgi:hypothetical protein